MERKEELEIIEKSRKDPKEFAPIFDKYYPAIFRYAMHRTGNATVASDIAAETFFKALNKLHTYRVTAAPFSSWLYRIANNEASYYFRKRKYEPASYDAAREEGGFPEPASREDVEKDFMQAQQQADNNKDFRELKEMITKMALIYQEVITLRFMEEKKISEIAEILGKNEGTVKSLLSRGLDRLRKQFSLGKAQHLDGSGIIRSESVEKKGGI